MQLSIVEQIRTSFKGSNRLAAFVGVVFGAFIPLATFAIAHNEHPLTHGATGVSAWLNVYSAIVLGGLTYSAITVYQWGLSAFKMRAKAIGFVVLLETVMVFSGQTWLAYASLAYLMLVNGIATGTILALDAKVKSASKRRLAVAKPKLVKPLKAA